MDLSGIWKVTWTDGAHGPADAAALHRTAPLDPERYLEVPVPMELHLALQEKGILEDLNFGTNTLKARWVAEQYWRYETTFTAPEEALNNPAWLFFKQLDLNATIVLNGKILATHKNAHLPCVVPVTGRLKPGPNSLGVSIESGLYDVADRPGSDYSAGLDAALNKRHWLRKPQYQFIWDWNPRLINVGITGPVRLEWTDSVRLDQVSVQAEPAADYSSAAVAARAFIEGMAGETELALRLRVRETGQVQEKRITVTPGLAAYEIGATMENPKLWWPRGHGDQALYTAELTLVRSGEIVAAAERTFGVRRIEIDQSPHPVEGSYFTLRVNGRPIFCKGGNWVPPDMIYSRVTRERLEQLVALALDANFNLLRIWGGGTFAGHDLLDICDRHGVLVWHDLLFACARYPADDPAFLAEVRREVTWAVREYAHHPALAVWCGNNEIEEGDWNWGYDRAGKSVPDYALYHHAIPVIMRREDPHRPYWPSSPYSPDHEPPNSPTTGDQHPWSVSLQAAGPDFWAYRGFVDRFPNEGGYLGASSPATLRQFLPERERFLRSFAWEHHDNSANFWTDEPGITYRAVRFWLGLDYRELGYDDYLFASALLQAEALSEYIANYRRRMFSSSAAIFWMYNDSWPVTHGWTIVDYYLRRKLAYHPVRRAFQPVTAVVADEGEAAGIYGVNDSPREWRGELRYGVFGTRGTRPVDRNETVTLPANSSTRLAQLERPEPRSQGAFAILRDVDGIQAAQARLLLARFKDLDLVADPEIRIEMRPGQAVLTSDVFVWGVAIDLDGEAAVPDNCFDLLPGIPYPIAWRAGEPPPRMVRVGNTLVSHR